MAVLAETWPPRVVEPRLAFDPRRGLWRLGFKALGTRCGALFACPTRSRAEAFSRAVTDWVGAFEGKYSRFMDTSLVAEINRHAGRERVLVDGEMARLLGLCQEWHFATGGIFDPTILPLIELWDYRLKRRDLPTNAQVAAARALVGWEQVMWDEESVFLPRRGMRLDFGGFGKEYAVDRAMAIAVDHEMEGCLVDFGQDLRAVGAPPDASAWLVGLEDPRHPGTTWTSLAINDAGVASSGNYLRFFEREGARYGHIIDSRTGRPAQGEILSVSVVAPSCVEAGVLATAGFTAGLEDGSALIEASYGAEGCIVTRTGIYRSARFYEYDYAVAI